MGNGDFAARILPARSSLTTFGAGGWKKDDMSGARIALPCGLAVGFALAAFAIAPHAIESASLLAAQDDPAELADRAVARAFDAAVAAREIDAALAANDVDLANSFLELARDQNVPLDPALADRVELANAHAATGLRSLTSF